MILGDPLFSLSFLDIFLSFLCHRPICLLALPAPGCAPGPLCESQSQACPVGCILALSGLPHLWVLICFPDRLSPPNQLTPAGFLSGLAIMDSMAGPPGDRGAHDMEAVVRLQIGKRTQHSKPSPESHKSSGVHSSSSPQ